MKLLYFLLGTLSILICVLNISLAFTSEKKGLIHSVNLPACRSCKALVESFKKGLVRTAAGKFEGGDTAWEEKNQGSYATSEIRLVEIQEKLCEELEKGRNQCFSLAEHHDELFEDWWFQHFSEDAADLHEWLCITKLKKCCPEEHYGKNCLPCPGHPKNVCSNNGRCRGAGTRQGNGTCDCDKGYAGDLCLQCADQYYASYQDNEKLLCSPCHSSCKTSCSEAGPKGCADCRTGWVMDEQRGCLDVNECAADTPVCKSTQFCVNSDGFYQCMDCDQACLTCTGDGPDMCDKCADGYTLINQICVETSQQRRASYVNYTRYLTYIGLCVATCIIFQKNVVVAAIVGLAVSVYISLSEYMLSDTSQSHSTIDPDNLLRTL